MLSIDNVQADVELNAENEWRLERLNILLQIEALLWVCKRKKAEMFPPYLHVLLPSRNQPSEAIEEVKPKSGPLRNGELEFLKEQLKDLQQGNAKLSQQLSSLVQNLRKN